MFSGLPKRSFCCKKHEKIRFLHFLEKFAFFRKNFFGKRIFFGQKTFFWPKKFFWPKNQKKMQKNRKNAKICFFYVFGKKNLFWPFLFAQTIEQMQKYRKKCKNLIFPCFWSKILFWPKNIFLAKKTFFPEKMVFSPIYFLP